MGRDKREAIHPGHAVTAADSGNRIATIRSRLILALDPQLLEITDESHLHAGHAGARDGRGHFHVRIVSSRFRGLSRLAQHRLVYEALGDLMTTDIHAVRISAET
jgi:BolA family transcriptional regulator, general stress-responsive regulator